MSSRVRQMGSNGFLDQVAQTLMEGVAVWDAHGCLVYANNALEALLGYGPGGLVGLHWTRLFPVELPAWAQAWQMPRVTESTTRHESELLCKDGATVPVLVNTRRLASEQQTDQVLTTFTDLSERHNLEAQVQHNERMASLGQNLSSVVHELNNSLTILSLQSKLLSVHRYLNPQVGENVAIIQDQTRRMLDMMDSLRSSENSPALCLATTDINALVSQTCALQLSQFGADGIDLNLDLAPDLPDVLADSDKLAQVVINIANNARHAIVGDGLPGVLRITTDLAQSKTGLPPRIRIQFVDSGRGIPPDVLPHIFEPFFTTKDASTGMGLGLAICEQIIASHGGCIRAENNAQGGATFTIELPTVRSAASPASRTPGPGRAAPHLLIVDDEEAVAHSVKRALQMAGYNVTTASSAQQALGILAKDVIDLVITDVVMPPMGGQQFWQALKESYPHLASRVIFATGDSSGRQWREYLRDRGCAYISKPFQVNELIDLVSETLQRQNHKITSLG